jgi:2-dehydro-3-deoxyphosphogluconate aldolase / (4S)-4-hydroxy-2-oxoglutarate aldolase
VRFRTVAILRGFEPLQTADLAESCWSAGMDLVEVPVQDVQGWDALLAVAELAGDRVFGAGTVLSPADAHRAVVLGAKVIVSPGIDADVVRTGQELGVTPLPGVVTPTDVALAARLGVPTCKLFPAGVVGTGWLGAMKGPFPAMRFVAVGGVDLGNAKEFLAAGAAGVALGSSITDLIALDDPAAFVSELHTLCDASWGQPGGR